MKLGNFFGQETLVKSLQQDVIGATAKREPMLPLLITGESGTGKNTLIDALADFAKVHLFCLVGKVTPESIVQVLHNVELRDFLFFDECHNLPHESQEFLYQLIDAVKGVYAQADKTAKLPGSDFTFPAISFIFATDQPGKLLNALHRRIAPNIQTLRPYSDADIKAILRASAAKWGILLPADGEGFLVNAAHGIPGVADNLVQGLRHFSKSHDPDIACVRTFLSGRGIWPDSGFNKLHREYLKVLHTAKATSLDKMALQLGFDEDYITRQVEKPLFRRGYIKTGTRGRELTEKGTKYCVQAFSSNNGAKA
jgi:Holliday junction resolvasome RuvABC ATP-dependent DNA helicase subunit